MNKAQCDLLDVVINEILHEKKSLAKMTNDLNQDRTIKWKGVGILEIQLNTETASFSASKKLLYYGKYGDYIQQAFLKLPVDPSNCTVEFNEQSLNISSPLRK